jgi:hypothetical protein
VLRPIMKTIFHIPIRLASRDGQAAPAFLLPGVSDGRAADSVGVPEGSAAEATVSQARLSLAEARKTQSDSRTAVGHYLDAADTAVRSVSVSSGYETNEEARSIYNAVSQEVTVLLRSSAEL